MSQRSGLLLFITPAFPPVANAVAVRSARTVTELETAGYDVCVITSSLDSRQSEVESETPIVRVKSAEPDNKHSHIKRLWQETRLGFAFLKEIYSRRHARYVFITSPPFFTASIIVFACRVFAIPYFFEVRDRYPEVLFSLGILEKNGPTGNLLLKLERTVYRGSCGIVSVTDALVNDIEEFSPHSKVICAANGFDEKQVKVAKEKNCRSRNTVIMHGNFGKFFDEKIFFRIAERLAYENNLDYEINIIGSGPKFQLLRNAGLPNVHIYDGMSQEHIYKHLANASIGLSVHKDTEVMRRAFPVKVYEFVGAALPSVVIPVNQAHEVFGLYRLGKCFSENNWQEAASFLLDLLSDDDLLGEYQRNVEENRWRFDRVQQVKKISRMVLKSDKQSMQ